MRLAISNIAWSPAERLAIYEELAALGVRGLEIAPGLLFPECPDPLRPGRGVIKDRMAEAVAFGLRIVSIQSVHFGAEDARLFGTTSQRHLFTERLARAIDLAGSLGAPTIVLGSPKQRVRPQHLAAQEATAVAVRVLQQLGDMASDVGTTLSIEVNPTEYGTNFVTTFDDGIRLVEETAHGSIKMCLDMGAIALIGGSDVSGLVRSVSRYLGHVHISDPYLAPTPSDPELVRSLAVLLQSIDYSGWSSIEMRSQGLENREAVRLSVVATRRYTTKVQVEDGGGDGIDNE